ncbi:MAG: type II toxin-antitoxin system PemK/MazF family toxin [archaeon]|nr:type II toxin-antitoxin system PemK/MazF family toxin [archaeon]
MFNSGEVVLVNIQFTDSFEVKKRPCVVLFTEMGDVVVAGITSNKEMQGIPLSVKEGAIKDSVIKTNYVFTTTESFIEKKLFELTKEKKQVLYENLLGKLNKLK